MVVPLQSSAHPYHDWNCRITKECYAANSASRILDGEGRITDIVNNYRYISFNFGPTLLDWLERKSPNVYRRIITADRESAACNNGHGNAIAQAYNHSILPLDTHDDAELQILWGLDNFRHHFKREAEGIWLPETAVNQDVIDTLIAYKIKFIILSPWQADAVREEGQTTWQPLNGKPAPWQKPYNIMGKNGRISVFFYNHELASGISFGHYLQSADRLYDKLLTYTNKDDPAYLIHTATDGEIYGHHEPFGDMCLASLIQKVNSGNIFTLSNYGFYLEQFPSSGEVALKSGEERKGTSWSCPHGVSRWYKDCGCSTGGEPGWNQKWRTPLREAFTYLSQALQTVFTTQLKTITMQDSMNIVKSYSEVINNEISPLDFASRYVNSNDSQLRIKFLSLLEGQRYRMYMFTSCGWFFSDISGLEPVQNMRYALRAFILYKKFLPKTVRTEFLRILSEAKSNITKKGSGKDIFFSIEKNFPEGFQAALYFCTEFSSPNDRYGKYRLNTISRVTPVEYSIEITDLATTEHVLYTLFLPKINAEKFTISIKNQNNPEKLLTISNLSDIDLQIRKNIIGLYVTSGSYTLQELVFILKYCAFLSISAPLSIQKQATSLITNMLKEHLTTNDSLIPKTVFDEICTLIECADQLQLPFDRTIPQNIIFDKLSKVKNSQPQKNEYTTQIEKLCDLMGINHVNFTTTPAFWQPQP